MTLIAVSSVDGSAPACGRRRRRAPAQRGLGRRIAFALSLIVLLLACAPPLAGAADHRAPVVSVTAPAAGARVSGTITLAADASDRSGVREVRWYVDGSQVAGDAAGAPWQASWSSTTVADGTHTIVAKAVDPAGNWGTSRAVSFTVSNTAGDITAPTVAVTSPAAGAKLSGTVTLAASASDNVGVTQVKWYVDGAEVAWDGDGAPWQASWNSAGVADGQHTVLAKAADAAGNWGTSASVSFSVANATAPPPSGAPCGTASAAPAAWDHVVWIVFENKTYAQIIGSANAPYINSIAKQCGSASSFFAEAHPSLPNYIAMTSGSTQGITDDSDPSAHPLTAASIFSQLGGGWRALQESMPSNCALSNSGQYAVRHNPAAYYTNIRTACQAQDVPLAGTPDLSARFTFVTPDLCHDMHSSSCGSDTVSEVKNGDSWLSGFLPKVLGSTQYQAGRTAVFVTWDEDDYSSTQHIATLVLAPSVPAGTTVASTFNHYSMLRSTEEMLAIGTYLGGAASATSMRTGFHL